MFENQPQVHLDFYFVVSMDKVAVGSTASKDYVERLIYNLDRFQDVMIGARNKINKVFEDLSEYQYAFASKNGVIDVDRSKIMDINTGWGYHIRNQGQLDQDQGN